MASRKPKVDKSQISAPTPGSFAHVAHMGYDADKGFISEGIDQSWLNLLNQVKDMGVDPSVVYDPANEKFIKEFVRDWQKEHQNDESSAKTTATTTSKPKVHPPAPPPKGRTNNRKPPPPPNRESPVLHIAPPSPPTAKEPVESPLPTPSPPPSPRPRAHSMAMRRSPVPSTPSPPPARIMPSPVSLAPVIPSPREIPSALSNGSSSTQGADGRSKGPPELGDLFSGGVPNLKPSSGSWDGPPQFESLFAGGMPKLRQSNESRHALPPNLAKVQSIPKAKPISTTAPPYAPLTRPRSLVPMVSHPPPPPRSAAPADPARTTTPPPAISFFSTSTHAVSPRTINGMTNNSNTPQSRNLTGQVWISNPVPEFSGNYSSVHRGFMEGSSTPIAIKVIKATGAHDSVKRKLLREITVWSKTDHPNIYPFFGHATDAVFGPFGALISPWCRDGDASKFLDENGEQMSMIERISLWKGVIDGVTYLHSQKPPIVHGDLKPGNILMDGNKVPRICDFGLARVFSEEFETGMTTTSEHTGTARYLSPELVISETSVPPTRASDVYALGSLGLEFIYLQKPYFRHMNNFRGQIFRDMRNGVPPASSIPPRDWPARQIWPLLLICWEPNPSSRPLASTIGRMLMRIDVSLPSQIVQRIVSCIATMRDKYDDAISFESNWREYSGLLRNLCLVSKAFWRITIPFLYGKIILFHAKFSSRLSSLRNALNSSGKKVQTHYAPEGYGVFTKLLGLSVGGASSYDLSSGIQALLSQMIHLQMISISVKTYSEGWNFRTRALKTSQIWGVSQSFFLNQAPEILAAECIQRLELHVPRDNDLSTTDLQAAVSDLNSEVVLPTLREICVEASMSSNSLATMSNWVLPSLHTLELSVWTWDPDNNPSLRLFIQYHGAYLRVFSLTVQYGGAVMSSILGYCLNLRFLRITSEDFPTLDLPHPHENLETFIYSMVYPDMSNHLPAFQAFTTAGQNLLPSMVDAKMCYRAMDMAWTCASDGSAMVIEARDEGPVER